MQDFMDTFDHLMEFHFIDGPWVSERPIEPYYVKKGVKPPYQSWFSIEDPVT